jgi:DNA-binding response OmpR family regulator
MNTSPPIILVLDDEPDLLEFLSVLLADEGYQVQTVQTADDLERTLQEGVLPALFVLDLLLSGSDGRGLVQRLKDEERTRDVPILMASAHPSADREANAAGADAFLSKPFEIDEFLAVVAVLLSRQQGGSLSEKDQGETQPSLPASHEQHES